MKKFRACFSTPEGFHGVLKHALHLTVIAAVFLSAHVFADEAKITYQDQILPIFRNTCLNCHNPDKAKAGLDLSSYAKAMAGSSDHKVIEPGNASNSVLYKVCTQTEEPKMPQRGDRLPDKELEIIRKWIEMGALENSGSKVVAIKANPALTMLTPSIGKPTGPIATPRDLLLEPVVRTSKAGALESLAADPWAPFVAVGSQRQVVLYNTDSLQLAGVLAYPEGVPHVLHFSRNGSLLLAGGGQGAKLGKVVLWELASGKRVGEIGDEFDEVLAADVSSDHALVALGGSSKVLKIFSTRDGQLIKTIKKHTDWIRAVEFSPDAVLLASGDRSGGLVVWESSGHEFYTLAGHKASVTDVSFRGDSNVLASAGEDGQIKLWDMQSGKQINAWTAHAEGVQSVAFTHDGRLVSSGRDKTVKVWGPDGKLLRTMEAFPDIAMRAVFSHDGNRVIGGDWSGAIRVWNTGDGAKVGELAANPPTLAERLAEAEKRLSDAESAKAEDRIKAARGEMMRLKAARANVDLDAARRTEVKFAAEQAALVEAGKAVQAQADKAWDDAVAAERERIEIVAHIKQKRDELDHGAKEHREELKAEIEKERLALAAMPLRIAKLKQTAFDLGADAIDKRKQAEVAATPVQEARARIEQLSGEYARLMKDAE